MVDMSRNPDLSRAPTGWDPYEVWYLRVRHDTAQFTKNSHVQHAEETDGRGALLSRAEYHNSR